MLTMNTKGLVILTTIVLCVWNARSQKKENEFVWPEGKTVAISLTFDDARVSQIDAGVPLLDEFDVKATFYVLPSGVEQRLQGWRKAVAAGHEIGNHSLNHPCTGNFMWARPNALEGYSLTKMRTELSDANKRVKDLLGVTPVAFAYPCGQTFVGRGRDTKSYVPLVAELFQSGRGWLDEGPNDPLFCDFSQLTGMESDGKTFDEVLALIEQAKKNGQWLILAGHEIAESGSQTTQISMLRKLLEYAKAPENEIWIAPISTVGKYVQTQR